MLLLAAMNRDADREPKAGKTQKVLDVRYRGIEGGR